MKFRFIFKILYFKVFAMIALWIYGKPLENVIYAEKY